MDSLRGADTHAIGRFGQKTNQAAVVFVLTAGALNNGRPCANW